MVLFWQGRQDSNSRHLVLETSALPTELRPYLPINYNTSTKMRPVMRNSVIINISIIITKVGDGRRIAS